jgi:hypothetical protein
MSEVPREGDGVDGWLPHVRELREFSMRRLKYR